MLIGGFIYFLLFEHKNVFHKNKKSKDLRLGEKNKEMN